MLIRLATDADWPAIWPIFRAVVAAGDTYPYAPDTPEPQARRLWMEVPQATYIAFDGDQAVGTYYLKANQAALGAHVCNAGYMVAGWARGRGLGEALCRHSLDEARRLGYRAMQYNLVVTSNAAAVRLWTRMGFETVGTLPGAFQHASLGYVDALVMYRDLTSAEPIT